MGGGVTGPTGPSYRPAPKPESLLQKAGLKSLDREQAGFITNRSGRFYAWGNSGVHFREPFTVLDFFTRESNYISSAYPFPVWEFSSTGQKDPGFHIDLSPSRMAIVGRPRMLRLSVLGSISRVVGDEKRPQGKYARLEVHVSDGSKKESFVLSELNPASKTRSWMEFIGDGSTNPHTFQDFAFELKGFGPLTRIEVMLVTDSGWCHVEIKDLRIE